MRSEAEVVELLRDLVPLQNLDPSPLTTWEAEAFPDMLDQVEAGRPLSPRQAERVLEAADRLQLKVTPENLFSGLPEQRQRAERARASSVVLPWEKGLMARPLRPPGR